jgi:hypothetical protein
MKKYVSLFISFSLTIYWAFAQTDTSRWQTFTHSFYTIDYPKKGWVLYVDSMLRAEFALATDATFKKPYDRDRIVLFMKNNYDGIYGDMKEYAAAADEELKKGNLVSAKLTEKGKLAFYEKVSLNKYGKMTRKIKSRVYFINKNLYELEFDSAEKTYSTAIAQVDSIFDSFSPTDYKATIATAWSRFEKPTYSIQYPSNWNMAVAVPAHADFLLNKPQKSTDKGFWDNVYLMINNFKTTTPTLASYSQTATNQLKSTLKNALIHQSKQRKTANFTCQEVISEGMLGKHLVKMKQWHVVKGKRAYTLTYAARVESFDEVEGIIETMFNSFVIK